MIEYLFVDDIQIHRTANAWLAKWPTGLGLSPPRRDVSPRANRPGAIDRTRWHDGRTIDLPECVIAADGEESTWAAFDAVKQRLQLGDERVLRFRRRGMTEDEQIVVRVSSALDAVVRPSAPVIAWGVSLFAEDPRMYGTTLRGGSYDPSAAIAGGGVSFPLTFPLQFSTTTSSHLEVVNSGNTDSPPILTVHGPVVNPVIDNDTIGESIRLTYALGSGDEIRVDVGERSVQLNGAERKDLFDARLSSWWELAPGTNRLRLRGSGMASDVTELTVLYRNARN